MTNQEKMAEKRKLLERIEWLRSQGMSERLLQDMGYFCVDGFGDEQGQLRAGELGKWDLFYSLHQNFGHSRQIAVFAVGLDLKDIDAEEKRDNLQSYGVDPDNTAEVADYERIGKMSHDELDVEIKRLEEMLS